MDLQDQLKNLFPNHEPFPDEIVQDEDFELYIQKDPLAGSPVSVTEWRLRGKP